MVNDNNFSPQEDKSLAKDTSEDINSKMEVPTEGLATLIGKDVAAMEQYLGSPNRIDPSAYGYDWWIYKKDLSEYIQVGVKDDRVVTLYAIGSNVNIAPFEVGQKMQEIYSFVPIEPTIDLDYEGSSYRFELTENDMNLRPLVRMGDFFVQINIDKFDGIVSSVRFMDAETLIKLQAYEFVYVGELLEVNSLELGNEVDVSEGSQKQIYDISNVMRARYNLEPLEWDQQVSEVALAHSIDMFETEDFSHTSEKYGELADRLDAGEVFYQIAGENIAANYADAPAVMEGWLNSKGHRETLLNESFTHIGVGVYKKHYTQNFIQKWESESSMLSR